MERLDRIENALPVQPEPYLPLGLLAPDLSNSYADNCQSVLLEDVQTRISRMENILLQTPMADFEELDRKLKRILSHTQVPAEPDFERSPEKPCLASQLKTSHWMDDAKRV